jgi:sterol desaturase/sphingolipid hydroxylase (fatty acid hydroxylase superfamily)
MEKNSRVNHNPNMLTLMNFLLSTISRYMSLLVAEHEDSTKYLPLARDYKLFGSQKLSVTCVPLSLRPYKEIPIISKGKTGKIAFGLCRMKAAPPSIDPKLLLAKWVGLALYYSVLVHFGLNTMAFKFTTFLILTPIVKYCFQYDSSQHTRMWFSIISDCIAACFYFWFVPKYLFGPIFAIYPVVATLFLMCMEWTQYLLFDYGTPNAKYVVQMSLNPLDNVLIIVLCSSYYILGTKLDFDAPTQHHSFFVYMVLWIFIDFAFGALHYWSHVNPVLWKYHLKHHRYKLEDLNMFANFYAHIYDTFIMNASFLMTALACAFIGGDTIHFTMDMMFTAVITHNKYCQDHISLPYYFEVDLADLILRRRRMSEYHYLHHKKLDQNFGAVGYVTDSFFQKYLPMFGMGRMKKPPKTVEEM